MKRCSWLTAFVCLLSSSGAFAQQYRPAEPRFDGEYRSYSSASDASGQPVRPVRYQEDLQLDNQRGPWNPGPAKRPVDATEASRAVADQLRQQYHSNTNVQDPPSSSDRVPAYYPASPPTPTYRGDERSRSTVVEPARYSRTPSRGYDEPQTPDSAPGPMAGNYSVAPVPSQAMQNPPYPPPSQNHGNDPGRYADGGGSDPYSDPGCYDDGFFDGQGGRFRARRGAGMAARGPAGNDYYGSDCGTGDCGNGYNNANYGDDQRRHSGGGGSRFAQLFSKCGRDVYTVVGARWLYMRRDGADYKSLSYENAMPSNTLLVSDANLGPQQGIEAFIVRQDECGQGWEGRYWGLISQTNVATLGNMPITQLTGLNSLPIPPWGSVGALYNDADYHRVERSSEFHSFEWNLLNHASVCANNSWLFRGIFGVRVMRFRDALQYSAHSSTNFGFGFDRMSYNIMTRNTFVGAQAGGSGEYCVTDKLRLGLGANAGLGTNFMDADQEIANSNGVLAPHPGGGNFSYMNSANDLSVFGEFDARLYYHVSCNWRLSCGYRVLGLTGVALAQNQIPYAFTSLPELNSVKRDGGLLLHGLTLGAEFSY